MDFKNIYTELEKYGTDEVIKNYVNKGAKGDLFGVSYTDLQKIKGTIVSPEGKKGIHHSIAKELWNTRNLDARMLACMIADPSLMTRTEANKWVGVVNFYAIADLFAELIAKTSFGIDEMYFWLQSRVDYVKRVGFLMLKYFAENDSKRSDIFFSAFIQKIKQEMQTSGNWSKEAMCKCMVAIGKRNVHLRDLILDAARGIGPVVIEEGAGVEKSYIIDELVAEYWQKSK